MGGLLNSVLSFRLGKLIEFPPTLSWRSLTTFRAPSTVLRAIYLSLFPPFLAQFDDKVSEVYNLHPCRLYTTFSRHPGYDSLNFQTSWTS